MGDIYHEKNMCKEAYEAYDSALVYKPDNVLVLNNYAYYLALEKKDLEKAEAMSFRTIKADPKSYNELDTYAWILFLEEKFTEAKIYIEQSLKNGGDSHPGIVEHAGDIFFVNGDLKKAMDYWQQADEMGSDSKTLKKKIKQKKYIED
jgi:Tfp pilus assembly protein PilF